eukprot:TRINITY_DN8085_c0_g1_i1.p1 TRINITY_DN8085_c0_g1~~TRINITY_DN8085_c0_g1_i1.p1  ORF type:complete len:1518 (+),score=511.61 TRINITY_DN8085_c0_g1_i1:81-4634(+)
MAGRVGVRRALDQSRDSPREKPQRTQMDEREFDRFLEELCQKYESLKGDRLAFADLPPLLHAVSAVLQQNLRHLVATHPDARPWIKPTVTLLRETVRQFEARQGGDCTIDGKMLSLALVDLFSLSVRDEELETRAAARTRNRSGAGAVSSPKFRRMSRSVQASGRWQKKVSLGAKPHSCLSQSVEDPSIRRLRLTQEGLDTKQQLLVQLKQDGGETDWRDLTTLRELFLTEVPGGFVGLTQDEFVQLFEAKEGPGVYKGPFEGLPDPVSIFGTLDVDGGGYLDWDEFSAYLIASQLRDADDPGDDGDAGAGAGGAGGGHVLIPSEGTLFHEHKRIDSTGPAATTKKLDPTRHQKPITHIAVYNDIDMYYTADADGMVKAWHKGGVSGPLYAQDVLQPPDADVAGKVCVVGLMMLPGSQGVLVVAKNNRVIYTFSCSSEGAVPLRTFVGTAVLTSQTTSTFVPEYVRDAAKTRFYEQGGAKSKGMRKLKRSMNNFCILADCVTDHLTAVTPLGFPTEGCEGDTTLALASDTGCVYLYVLAFYASSSKCMFHYRHPARLAITSVATLPEKRALVITYEDCSVRWVAVEKKTVLFEANLGLEGKAGIHRLNAVSFCPDVNLCASACGSRVDIGNPSAPRQYRVHHRAAVVAVGWVRIERSYYLFSLSGQDRVLNVWETRNFRLVQSLRVSYTDPGRESEPLRGFVFDRPNSRLLLMGRTKIVALEVGRRRKKDDEAPPPRTLDTRDSPRPAPLTPGATPGLSPAAPPSETSPVSPNTPSPAPLSRPMTPVDPLPGVGPAECLALFYDAQLEHVFAVVNETRVVTWDIKRGVVVGELNLNNDSGSLSIITTALYRAADRHPPSSEKKYARLAPILILGNFRPRIPLSDDVSSAVGDAGGAYTYGPAVRQLGLWDTGAGVRVATFSGIDGHHDLRSLVRLPGAMCAAGGNVCVFWRRIPTNMITTVEIEPSQRINVRDGFVVGLHWNLDSKVLGISTSWAYLEYASRDLDDPAEDFLHVRTLDLRSFFSARTEGVDSPGGQRSPAVRRRMKMWRRRSNADAANAPSPAHGRGRFLPSIQGGSGGAGSNAQSRWARVREMLGFGQKSTNWAGLMEKINTSLTVPSVTYVGPGLFFTCKTSGYVIMWEAMHGLEAGKMKATACFHAAHQRSEVVTQLTWISAQCRVVAGDSKGYVSVFDFAEVLEQLREEGKNGAIARHSVGDLKASVLHVTPKLAELKRRAAWRTFIRDPTKPPPENEDCILKFLRPSLVSCFRPHTTAVSQLHVVVGELGLILSLSQGNVASLYQQTGLAVITIDLSLPPGQFRKPWPVVMNKHNQATVQTAAEQQPRRKLPTSPVLTAAEPPSEDLPGSEDGERPNSPDPTCGASNLTKSHCHVADPQGRLVMYNNNITTQLIQPSTDPAATGRKNNVLDMLKQAAEGAPNKWELAMNLMVQNPNRTATLSEAEKEEQLARTVLDKFRNLTQGVKLPPLGHAATADHESDTPLASPTADTPLDEAARFLVP